MQQNPFMFTKKRLDIDGTRNSARMSLPPMRYLSIPLILLVILGTGCISSPEPVVVEEAPAIVSVMGAVQTFDAGTRHAELLSPSALENVVWPEGEKTPSVGQLWEATGTRDASSGDLLATAVSQTTDADLYVVSPGENATVTSPLLVTGFARATGEAVGWTVRDMGGNELVSGDLLLSQKTPGALVPFAFDLFLPALQSPDFTFELSLGSSEKTERRISTPVHLLTTNVSALSIFFQNATLGNANCSQVFPAVRDVAQTSAIGRASLLELFSRPSPEEAREGFVTAIPPDAVFHSLVIHEGVAIVDVNSALKRLVGTCAGTRAKAQITQTLLQVPSIDSIVITADGAELKM